ncbi:hypothetical protein [Nitriliruptor alkaliphilus]|uniref:hypothetical protein n=1 Tax=Nitriliruptor alkaliphilus TaxID=427918 RepID=UPI000695B9CE|nr:hypothetical protein [Nitriliruptor alkaliphilus]
MYLQFGFVQFRVDPADVPRMIRDATARRLASTLALTRIGPDGSVHRMSVGNLGHVVYELVDPAQERVATAQRLSEVLVDHAPMLEYGLVRLGLTPMVGWHRLVDHLLPRLPHRRGSYSRRVRHLEPSRVPDAYGIQLLSDQHLAGGPDLTGWEVGQVTEGMYLVTAPDLHAWFDHDQPDEGTLERARQNFAPLILTSSDLS